MSMPPLAILAGGLATRLRPITHTIPKSLVPVMGEPFLGHQLRLVASQGFARIVLCVGHMGDRIEDYVRTHDNHGLEIAFSHDGDVGRGTGGAIRNALPLLGDAFFVTYGDSYLPIDVRPVLAVFEAAGLPGLMTVLHNRDRWDRSNVAFDGARVLRHEKRRDTGLTFEWIDYGLSLFSREAIADWPDDDPFDLALVTASLAERGQLAGYAVAERFYEIGNPDGLKLTETYIREKAAARDASPLSRTHPPEGGSGPAR